LQWAKGELEVLKHTRTTSSTTSEIDLEGGQWKPIKCIIDAEGGDDAAKIAAMNIVCKCMQLHKEGKLYKGRSPIQWNEWSLRCEFLHLTKSFSSAFKQDWNEQVVSKVLSVRASTAAVADAEAGTPVKEPSPAAKVAIAAGTKRQLPSASGSGGGSGAKRVKDEPSDVADDPQKAARKEMQKQWSALASLKSRFNIAMSSYMTMEARIRTDSDKNWSWAQGYDLKELQAKKMQIDTFCEVSDFWKSFAVNEVSTMKKCFADTAAALEKKKLGERDVVIRTLEQKIGQLTKMYNARVSGS
jgi:hypothetical protein